MLDHVEIVAQGEVLVDNLDAEGGGFARIADADGLAFPDDLSGVGLVDAGHAFDQHDLAGAVIAHKGGHLSSRNVEIDAVQRPDRPEVLFSCRGR